MMLVGCCWHWWGWVGRRGPYRVTCDRQRYPTFKMLEGTELWINSVKVHKCTINRHLSVGLTCTYCGGVIVWLQVVLFIILIILLTVFCTK